MNKVRREIYIGLALLVLIWLSGAIEPLLTRGINPIGVTRHVLEVCDAAERELEGSIGNPKSPDDLAYMFGAALKKSKAFRSDGYVTLGEGLQVLDGWKVPLIVCTRSNLPGLSKINPTLLSKTNKFIVWSCGKNKSNEFGYGDDFFLPVSAEPR